MKYCCGSSMTGFTHNLYHNGSIWAPDSSIMKFWSYIISKESRIHLLNDGEGPSWSNFLSQFWRKKCGCGPIYAWYLAFQKIGPILDFLWGILLMSVSYTDKQKPMFISMITWYVWVALCHSASKVIGAEIVFYNTHHSVIAVINSHTEN